MSPQVMARAREWNRQYLAVGLHGRFSVMGEDGVRYWFATSRPEPGSAHIGNFSEPRLLS